MTTVRPDIDEARSALKAQRGPLPDGVLDFEAKALAGDGLDFHAVPPRYRTPYFSHIMGGYAAESLMYGDVSTGSEDDLRKATEIAEPEVETPAAAALAELGEAVGRSSRRGEPVAHPAIESAGRRLQSAVDQRQARSVVGAVVQQQAITLSGTADLEPAEAGTEPVGSGSGWAPPPLARGW